MQTTINWTHPITWIIAAALGALLISQLWLILRNNSLTGGRKWLRAGLNVVLWLIALGYFLQIEWPKAHPATHALLVADGIPGAFTRHLQDSLHIQDRFTSRNYKADYDSVTLVGQHFPAEVLTKISNAAVQWIPYQTPDQLQSINWKGIVRQGEMQQVTGRLQSSKKQVLRLQFGNQTLDSVALQEGNNTFAFRFPAFARGRSQVELALDRNAALDTLRFFTQSTEPLTVQFLLDNPDFESKTLADWLGKNGHNVQLSATLSKNISSQVTINKVGKGSVKTAPDLIITESSNAGNVAVKKAIADGRSVLFINLTNPETESRIINQALGSKWQLRRISNEPTVPLGNGLNALPYRFTDNLSQFAVTNYPIAVQRTSGRVGVSLVSETYPLSLSGDSTTYSRLWTAVLARLSRSNKNTVQVAAPVYDCIQQAIYLNNVSSPARTIRVGNDTLSVINSPINERTIEATLFPSQLGWQPIQDSLAMYVNDLKPGDPLAGERMVSQFMRAHAQYQTIADSDERKEVSQLPAWGWLVLFVLCLTALWLEPKF